MSSEVIEEFFFLPYKPSELPREPWLVLAPHPDDETFGMGGAILKATSLGYRVDVVIMTDGSRGGDSSRISEIRRQEAQKAASMLGCRKLFFLEQPDRCLKLTDGLIDQVSCIIHQNQYATLFFPSPLEPHPDHRVTARLGWEMLRKINFFCDPVSYEISVQGPCNLLVDISDFAHKKIDVMKVYESQERQGGYIRKIEAMNVSRTWSLPGAVTHAEAFFVWPKEDRPLSSIYLKRLVDLLSIGL